MIISAIYLAAGFSKRFGANKLLHRIEGKPMFQYTLEHLLSVRQETSLISQLIIVTQYDEIEQYTKQQSISANITGAIRIVRNTQSERGISSSLQIGLQAAGDADAYLFCVADQPYLRKETIVGLLQEFTTSNQGIGCVMFKDRYGSPTIFRKQYRQELLALQGDSGGKQIMSRNPEDIYRYQVINERELMDVDVRSISE